MGCDSCKKEFVDMLDIRIRAILAAAHNEGEDMTVAHAECFHLMELQRNVQGKPTCGVYDSVPPPPKFVLTSPTEEDIQRMITARVQSEDSGDVE